MKNQTQQLKYFSNQFAKLAPTIVIEPIKPFLSCSNQVEKQESKPKLPLCATCMQRHGAIMQLKYKFRNTKALALIAIIMCVHCNLNVRLRLPCRNGARISFQKVKMKKIYISVICSFLQHYTVLKH